MAALPLPAHLAVDAEPFDDDDLELWLENDGEEGLGFVTDPRVQERLARIGNFVIDDDGRAEWAGRKLADFARRRAACIEQHQAWLEQVQQSMNEELARLDPRIALFDAALVQYGVQARTADENRKTISLPSVTIKTSKASKPVVHVANEDTVIAWADRNLPAEIRDKVVKTTRKVLVLEFRKITGIMRASNGSRAVDRESGEVVPGTYVVEAGTVTASVTPK